MSLGRATISKFSRKIFYGFILAAALPVSEILSEDLSASIRLLSPADETLAADPGQTVNLAFLVENAGPLEETFVEELALPEGWRSIVPTGEAFSVAPNESELRLFAVHIPPGTPPGPQEAVYSARREAADTDPPFRVARTIEVSARLQLDLAVENRPESIIAGESYEAVFRASNRGNEAMEVALDSDGNPDYPIEGLPPPFELGGGQSRLVRLLVKTDPEETRNRRHFLRLRATGDAGESGNVTERAAMSVEVSQRAVAVGDPYHRIPSRLRVMGAYDDDGRGGVQAEVSGAGAIDETGRRSVDFRFRSPETGNARGLRRREEYRFDYYDESWDFGVGDRIFSLSPLTQRFGYGRGAEVNFYPGATGLGAYHRQSRFDQPDRRETGTYLMHDLGLVSVKGNYLQRTIERTSEATAARDRLYSLETRAHPPVGPEVGVEVAHGERRTDVSRSDYAIRLDAEGRAGNSLYYTLGKVYAGSDYFGSYRDMTNLYGTVRFPLYERLRGNASYRRHRSNLERDPERRSTAPREKNYTTGVSYPSPFGTRFSADVKRRERKDLIDPNETDFEVHSIRLGVSHRFDQWGFRNTVEGGVIEDHARDSERTPLEHYSTHLDFYPARGHRYSLFGRTGHDAFLARPERSKSAGVSGRWSSRNSLTGRARYTRTRTASDREFETAAAGISYRLPNEHSVELDGRWSRETTGEDRAGVFMSYTIPFGIPVRRKEGLGALRGNVIENGEPLAGAVVTANGLTAVTDQSGRFRFPALEEDIYTVRLDQNSIPDDRTTSEPMPKVVEIFEGETGEVNMELVKTSRIFGQVTRYAFEGAPWSDAEDSDRPALEEAEGLAGVPVEIRSRHTTRSVLTDEQGRFLFEQLRPGTWRVRIPPEALPPHHSAEREEVETVLAPGEDGLIRMRILPRERRIRMIDEQTLE